MCVCVNFISFLLGWKIKLLSIWISIYHSGVNVAHNFFFINGICPRVYNFIFHIKSKSVHFILYTTARGFFFIIYLWSVAACPPGSYGNNCISACPNQHYGENRGLKCNCGPGEECHTLHGCISSTNGEQGSGCAC